MNKLYQFLVTAILLGFTNLQLHAQCISTAQFGSGTASSTGSVVLTTCAYGGEYSTVTVTLATNYVFSATGGTGNYITITNTNNVVVAGAFGFSPLTVAIPSVGVYYMHLSTDAACGTDITCHTNVVSNVATPCSGVPPSSNAIASSTLVCPGATFNLGLSTTYTTSGLTYQWQSSTTGSAGPYTSIASGTNAALTQTAGTGSIWYQAIVTCTSSSASSSSTPVQIDNGIPNLNSVVTPTSLCGTSNVNLSLSSALNGVTYMWQSATSGSVGPYSSIPNGTTAAFTATGITSSTWFQSVVACISAPSTSVISAPVQVVTPSVTISNVPYFESFEGISTNNELPNCSWTASDLPNVCKTYTAATGSFNQMANTGTKYASFRYFTNPTGDYFYTNGINLTAGLTYSASAKYITDGLTGWSEFALLYGTTQSTTGLVSIASATGNLNNITYNTLANTFVVSTTGVYYLAVKCIGSSSPWYLTFDDLSVVQLAPCSGAPASNTVVANSTTICPGSSANLSLATSYTAGGLTYQWSTATSSVGPYTAITGATLSSLTATNITSTTWFQAVITCTNGASSTTATPVQISTGGSPCECLAYCTSSASNTADEEIFNVSIGTLSNTSTCAQTGGPGSVLNLYSNYAGMLAAPSLTASFTYTFSTTVGQCGSGTYSGIVTAFIDYNQNGVFTDPGELIYTSPYSTFSITGTTFTANVTVPATASVGVTRMRVVAVESSIAQGPCGSYTWGETEDYCVNISPAPPCATANGGTLSVASYSACNNQTIALTSNSVSIGSGTTYQWMVSTTNGGPYTAVSTGTGATAPSYTTGPLASTNVFYYVLQATCANASLTAISNQATVSVNPIPTASVTSVAPICAGQNLNLNSSTNIGTNFTWNGPNSFTSSVQNPTITNASLNAQGNYTVVVSASGCSATPVVIPVVIKSTILNINSNPASLCLGGSATLTAVGNATTLTWSNSSTATSIIVSPSSTTVYSVVGTGTSNCVASQFYTLSVANPTISATGATVCSSPGTGTLTASAFGPVSWYATSTSTTVLGTGNTFTANAVTTTTYYAQASNSATNTLFISLAGGNGSSGNMFNIVPQTNISVNGFDVHLSNTTTNTIEIWYRAGTWVGFNTSNAGWTLAGTSTVTGLGTGSLTPVSMNFTVPIAAGQTYGWYVTTNGGGNVAYTNGTGIGNIWASNSDLQVLEGNGGGYFSVTFSPRGFNGRVKYSKPGCTSPIIPVVLNVGPGFPITATAGSGTVCPGGSTPLNASGATTYTWSNGANGSMTTVFPTSSTVYTVTGSNTGSCTGTGTVAVTVSPLPTVSIMATQTTVCTNGSTVALSGSPSGGVFAGTNVSGPAFTPGSITGTFTPGYSYSSPSTGCSNTATTTIIVSTCTGIKADVHPHTTLALYPNPNFGEFTIELANGLNKQVEISDLTGRVVLSANSSDDKIKLNINSLANGVYFVKVLSNKTTEVIKVVKQ